MITIAGSGPSCEAYARKVKNPLVTIATKKRSLPSEYLFCRFSAQYWKAKGENIPLLLYYNRCVCEPPKVCPICVEDDIEVIGLDSGKWDAYWSKFIRKRVLSTHKKPSLGTCAVFAAVEYFGVDEVGLIGFDYILDGDENWMHDAIAERNCIESLVNVIDLRSR